MIEFKLSKKEEENLRKFIHNKHKNCDLKENKKHKTAKYSFKPTGIGDVVIYRCYCGKKKDIPDYDCW